MILRISTSLLLFFTATVYQITLVQAQVSSPFSLETTREALLLGSGAAMSIGGLVLMNQITPFTAAELSALDAADVNGFDRPAIGNYRTSWDGDWLLYGAFLFPLGLLANDRARRDWQTLGVIGAEVLLLQTGLNTIIKSTVLRARPYAYDPAAPLDKRMSRDARVSFYSGHTATSAALTFFVAKVFSDYLDDTTAKTLIWTGAALYPALVGYLRVDSGNHFPTDVIAGYAVGALLGYFVPEMHRTNKEKNISVNQTVNDRSIGISMQFRF
jgi:membrane-associated phospholipid phosphatase